MRKNKSIQPQVDMIEFEKGICILVDIPSIYEEEIKLELIRDTIFLEANMHLNLKKEEKILIMDFAEEVYTLEIELSSCIDKDSLIADIHHGLLCIQLEYTAKVPRKKIPIKFN